MERGLVLCLASTSGLQKSAPEFGELEPFSRISMVNTFLLKESNSIKVFVKEQIYLHHTLRVIPKSFALNNRMYKTKGKLVIGSG